MSGLGAIFERRGTPVDRVALQRMQNALTIYGSDKKNLRIQRNFGLCWCHQGGFTHEDGFEAQPVISGRWQLVFDGFLTYRKDLAKKLQIETNRLQKMPDSALVMAAWQQWQNDAPAKLTGDFSVIITDTEQNCLTAFRAPLSANPIFYYETPDRIVLASAPKGLFALGDISRKISETRIADSLILNYQDPQGSYYQAVRRVPLGHVLTITDTQTTLRRYYDIRNTPEVRFSNEQDYVEAAREHLNRAVQENMRARKTPAAMLSSGYDSSTVVVTMLEALGWAQNNESGQKLQTYTHVPGPDWDGRTTGPARAGDESGPVRALAQKYPAIQTRFLEAEGASIDQDLDQLFLLGELPPRNMGNMHWVMDLYRSARADGHAVILGGQSGNASLSFSGIALYAKLFRNGRWLKLAAELRASGYKTAFLGGLYPLAIEPNLPMSVARAIARLRGRSNQFGWSSYSLIDPDYALEMNIDERAEMLGWDTSYRKLGSPKETMHRMLSAGARDEGSGLNLAFQALTGVQSRDPLGDRSLIEFCAGLPDDQFLKNGVDRRLLKRVMAGKLPDEIVHATRGRQGADWHGRITKELPRYKADVAALESDPDMARRFDVPRLKKLLETWPDKTPLSAKDYPDYKGAMLGLSRALATARFIDWVEGKNR